MPSAPPVNPRIRATAAPCRAEDQPEVVSGSGERYAGGRWNARGPAAHRYCYLAPVAWAPVSSGSLSEGSLPRSTPGRRPARLSKTARIGLGLLLTLIGLFLLGVLFPTSPAAIAEALPVATAGILTLWVGGILLGQGSRT